VSIFGEPLVSFIAGWGACRLFEYFRTAMPADDTSTLSDEAYLDAQRTCFDEPPR